MSEFRKNKWVARTIMMLALLTQINLFAAPFAMAQTTGNLQGVVTDPQGAVVANATVRVTNSDTGRTVETTTNDEGFYRVTNLIPGNNYKVEVTATGFASRTLDRLPVRLATENEASIQLAVSGGGETVEVTAGAQLLESTQSQLSTNYTPEQLTQLPYVGSIDNLALLTPGVVTPGDTDFANGIGISANGNRGRSNNFQIDGQDNNDNSVTGPSLSITNNEAIGEYQVITNSFSAEFGRNSGAQINVITKPGTNEFHGSLFEYLQNSALDARDNIQKKTQQGFQFLADNGFSDFAGLAERYKNPDPFTNNRFGGAIGGPVKKDKAFFFATYERNVVRGETQANSLGTFSFVPTASDAAFLAQRFPNAATANLVSPLIGGGPAFVQGAGQFLLAPPVDDRNGDGVPDAFTFEGVTSNLLAPLAVVSNGNGGFRTIFGGEGVRIFRADATQDQVISRVDYNLTDNDRLTGRYIYDKSDFPLATGRFVAGAIFDVPSTNNNFGLTYTRTLSSRFVNEARFNFSRVNVKFGDPDANPLPGPSIAFAGTRSLTPGSLLTAFGTQNTFPQSRIVDVYQYQDSVSATLGQHALKFGADIRHQKSEDFFLPNFLGAYSFRSGGTLPANTFFNLSGTPRTAATAFENYILGRPRDINFALGPALRNTSQNDYFFFVQDDWRIRPNLTLNLGLRYEVSTTPFNPLIEKLNNREADPATAIFNTSFPLETRTATKLPLDKNNFGPRVGFAWTPNFSGLGDRFTNGRTVIRGGFGIAYDPPYFNIVNNTVTAAPFAASGTIRQTPGAAGAVTFPFLPSTTAELNLTPGTAGGDPRLFNQTRVDPNLYNPYTMSFNFGIQQEVYRGAVVEVRYVGSRIIGQFQTINGNPDLRFLALAGQELVGDPT
ncbi:MAG TPA: carboxypeptidase regulatory-like domain-containing protein, partial [Blastocatellia bacterium]|nr:carboxypeptidase regulatory-like domain-containing protein [Blastocatellia bacterium]